MQFTYDSGLAVLSIAIAIFGAFTSLVLTTRLRAVPHYEAGIRIALAGLSLGAGCWAMHAIAMTAIVAPVMPQHSLALAVMSAIVAALFASIALAVVGFSLFGRYSLPSAVLFLGCGFAATHYLGLVGLLGQGTVALWWPGLAGSIVFALEAAAIALWLAFRKRGVVDTVLGSLVLGLAAASMHYLGMAAVTFIPVGAADAHAGSAAPDGHLALSIAAGIYALCAISQLVFCIFTFSRPPAGSPAAPMRLQFQH